MMIWLGFGVVYVWFAGIIFLFSRRGTWGQCLLLQYKGWSGVYFCDIAQILGGVLSKVTWDRLSA